MSSIRACLAGAISAVVLTVALVVPGLAAAESAHPAGGSIDVQIWPEAGQTTVIVALEVPGAVKLPTVVRLPFPPGTEVRWAGEILGGDPAADPPRQPKIIIGADGGRYAQFTLTKSRRAQIDTTGLPLTGSGSALSGKVAWIQSVDASVTTLSVRLPSGATDVSISPAPAGDPQRNETGEALYTLPPMALARGTSQAVTFSYSIKGPGAAGRGSSGVTNVIIALGLALALAVAVLLALLAPRRPASAASAESAQTSSSADRDALPRRGAHGKGGPAEEPGEDDDSSFLID